MDRLKLVEIIRDLKDDNEFNMDKQNQRSINVSIENLIEMFKITEEDFILADKMFIAQIGENKDWITYSDSNDGEEDYYRDYMDEYGRIVYSHGERCIVTDYDKSMRLVKLQNDNIDYGSTEFVISFEQFFEDFVPYI